MSSIQDTPPSLHPLRSSTLLHVTKCNLSHFICTHIIIYIRQIYCGRWHRLDSGQGLGQVVVGGGGGWEEAQVIIMEMNVGLG